MWRQPERQVIRGHPLDLDELAAPLLLLLV